MVVGTNFSIAAVLIAVVSLGVPGPLQAQPPQAFVDHFGASRIREKGTLRYGSAGFMLLTQYGSRWKDTTAHGPGVVTDYDGLDTTVGYNYGTLGMQWARLVSNPCSCDLVVGAGVTVGMTSDWITESLQDGLHDYRQLPHVRRGRVDSGTTILGADVEAALWRSFHWSWIDVDLFAIGAHSTGTHHGETSAEVGAGVSVWMLRFQGSYREGFNVDQSIDPPAVGQRYNSGYSRWQAVVALDRTRYSRLRNALPSLGFGFTRSSGIFQNEEELLLSAFLEFPGLRSRDSWVLEHVNDLINNKDRGPTGGLRLTYVRR